jgi:hypothetical protein
VTAAHVVPSPADHPIELPITLKLRDDTGQVHPSHPRSTRLGDTCHPR